MGKNRPRTFIFIWLALWAMLFWCLWTPVPFTYVKMAALSSVILLWLSALVLFPRGRWLCLGVLLTMVGVVLWPASPTDSAQLRQSYVTALLLYKSTPYVWGGENGRGIDCSGLMRRSLVDALLAQGFETRNPSLWREAAMVWWRDCSAREMKNGYSGRIEPRFAAASLNQLETTRPQIGDLAVMRSGVHVLAFVGGKNWIQADPNLVNGGGKVIVTPAPSRSGWFVQKVIICRWKILDGPAS